MNRVLSEKLTGAQLVKFPAFHGTRMFITAFTRTHNLSLSWGTLIQFVPPSHFLKIHFNITLPFKPGSFKWYFSFRFSHLNSVSASLPTHKCYMTCSSQSSWFDHPNSMWWWVQSFFLCSLLHSPVTSCPLGPNIPLSTAILENPQPTVLPQCERPRFTPT